MRPGFYARLRAIAAREVRDSSIAEDMVQEAMLAAVLAGRADFDAPENGRWLAGAVRNQARMANRSATRRRRRESQWQYNASTGSVEEAPELASFLDGLPPSLKVIAALALSGHNRREIGFLLGIADTALRQRFAALRRKMKAAGLMSPSGLPGLSLDMAYGRIRDALLPVLLRHGGLLASHDPDGHLFVIRSSQNAVSRQPGAQTKMEAHCELEA